MGCGCGKTKAKEGFKNVNASINKQSLQNLNSEVKMINSNDILNQSPKPRMLNKILTFGEALASHISDGFSKTTKKEFAKRMEICMSCPNRDNQICSICGCYLTKKAEWRTTECPDKPSRWPKLKIKENEKEK